VGEAAPVADRVAGAVRPSEGRVEVGDDFRSAVGSDDATEPSPVRTMRLRAPDPVLQAPGPMRYELTGSTHWRRYAGRRAQVRIHELDGQAAYNGYHAHPRHEQFVEQRWKNEVAHFLAIGYAAPA
jgi:hypothetical protein